MSNNSGGGSKGSYASAVMALALHPLVSDYATAQAMWMTTSAS